MDSDNCVGLEGDPRITSIVPKSGPVGTKVEIRGCRLSGFEGDFDAVFVRKDGAIIPLYGEGTSWVIEIQPYCASGYETGRYSGITSPCETVEATPGVYRVYVTAWGKNSNEVAFTITE